ncbi:MAG: sulfatase [Candidatus Latescibacterota bacterium]
MNILFILADQFRHDCLGALAHPVVQTPNLDRLATAGTLFSRTYCAAMACGPARAALFTGYYADTHGMQGNQTTLMPPDLPVLPEYLAQHNYDTALVGKLHLKPMRRDFGFRYLQRHDAPYTNYSPEEAEDSAYLRYLQESAYADHPGEAVRLFTEDEASQHTDELRFMLGSNFVDAEHHEVSWTVRESTRYLRHERRRDQPFFLNCSFFGPHQPFLCPEPWDKLYPPDEIPLPPDFYYGVEDKPIFYNSPHMAWRQRRDEWGWDEGTYRQILSAYYGYVAMIDDGVGQLLQTLHDEGLADDTLVIFSADHGEFGGQFRSFYKGLPYEGSTHVPLIISDPRVIQQPATCTLNVSNIDLFATCLANAGAKIPSDAESRDLTPLWHDQVATWDNRTLWKKGNQSFVVRDDAKLLREGSGTDATYEFYDLANDPWEETNQFDLPRYATDIDALKQELDSWHKDQDRSKAERQRAPH